MMRIKIISPGKHNKLWLSSAILEYEKRLTKLAKIEWVFPKELKMPQETYSLLDVKGKFLTSEQFSNFLISKPSHTFVIGGHEGPCQNIIENASFKFSLSSLTFTHQMVRLVLIEQIYRGFEIFKGSSYHK
ncbi:MAG: 23S rRNA (pseudouridine(1915)-N(3))-methyltransferase RlmH [Chlamydiae bacterium]|jgi:23S rRNA (pseudouridine1915-N3)-methyltransferase|nr:23S rRNA (pseudouridine(1915)-N(3))-methyltransferase RlmH [Chlamydiota bacterium]